MKKLWRGMTNTGPKGWAGKFINGMILGVEPWT